MNDDLRVAAVAGRMLQDERVRGKFVGLARLANDVATADVHSTIGSEACFVSIGPVTVPNTLYYRRAVLRGDIALAKEPVVSRSKGAELGAKLKASDK